MAQFEVSFPGGQRVAAEYKGFRIETDQPVSVGGDASAPAPFELFLASLATCAGFFVLNFCKTRHLPTEGIRVTQDSKWDPETHRVSRLDIKIVVPPEFPEKYHGALIRAVEQCSVKRALHNPPEIVTETVVA